MDISDYKILQLIARNASEKAYLAIQPGSDNRVVIKFLSKSLLPHTSKASAMERFLEQGQDVSNISHPHIAKVHAVGHTKNVLYTITDYIEGESLKTLAGHICILDQIYIIKQIAEAIDYLAENGYNHFNIKPSNIILSSNSSQPMLVGFGFAEVMQLDFSWAEQELLLHPLLHKSPEKLCNASLDIRSDLYNLGIMFYTLLTNMTPVQVAPSLVASGKHIEVPTTKLLPSNMKIFQPFFDRAIAHEPDDRFKSGQELTAVLDSIDDDEIAYIKNQQTMASSTQEASKPENSKTQYSNNVVLLKTTQNTPKEPPPKTPKSSAKPETSESKESKESKETKDQVSRKLDTVTVIDTLIGANEEQAQNQPNHIKPKRSPRRALLLFILFLAVTCYFLTQQDESYSVALYNQLSQLIKLMLRLLNPS